MATENPLQRDSHACDPVNCSLPGSSVHGIFQVRILEWVAISYSKQSSWPRDQTCVSCVSCMARRIIHHCATWEAPILHLLLAERPKGLLTDKLGGQECRFSDACMMCSKLLQSCPARTLKWIAMPSSRDFSQPRDWASVSYVSYTGRWVVFDWLFVCLFVCFLPLAPPGKPRDPQILLRKSIACTSQPLGGSPFIYVFIHVLTKYYLASCKNSAGQKD